MSNAYTFLFFVLLLWVSACTSEPDDYAPDYGYDYYPLAVGYTEHWEVDTIYYDVTSEIPIDTVRWQVKEEVVELFIDDAQDTTFRIERYLRKNSADPWVVKDVYTAALFDNQAIRTEENLRFIKLVFPPRLNQTWEGNQHIDTFLNVAVRGQSIEMFKDWNYQVLSVGDSDVVNGKMYDEVLEIEVANSESTIEYRYGTEKYARGEGLIYRELWILDTQCQLCCNAPIGTIPNECVELPWYERADEGFILIQKRID